MSEEEFQLPVTHVDAMFIQLHEEMLSAERAGFTKAQAFHLVRDLFNTRLTNVAIDHEYQREEDDE